MPWTSSKSILTPQLRLIKQYNCPATFPKHWTETTILIYDWLEVALGSQSQGYMTCQSVTHGNVGERFHNKLVNPTPTSQKNTK